MVASKSHNYASPEDYLEGEKISPIKHEYRQGEIQAMAGSSDSHETIAGNLFALLRNHVRGRGCRIYIGNMKARIEQADVFQYPEILVTCDERDRSLEYFKRYPRLIVEVLSPTTAVFDRGNKFADYRTLETLQEYVLINQERMALLNTSMNSSFRNGYKPSRVSFVTSSEKFIHTPESATPYLFILPTFFGRTIA